MTYEYRTKEEIKNELLSTYYLSPDEYEAKFDAEAFIIDESPLGTQWSMMMPKYYRQQYNRFNGKNKERELSDEIFATRLAERMSRVLGMEDRFND